MDIVIAERCAKCDRPPVEGSYFCTAHGGVMKLIGERRKRLYDFNKTEYLKALARRAEDIESNPEFNTVKSELGILRVVLERLMEQCDSDEKLIIRQGEIVTLIDKIGKLSEQLRNTEKELGLLLSKEQAKELAGKLLSIIVDATTALKDKVEATKLTLINKVPNIEEILPQSLFLDYMERIADEFGDVLRQSK